MNAALGRAGVVLAFVSAIGGVASLAVALATGRRHLLRQASTFVAFVAGVCYAFVAVPAQSRGRSS